MTCQRCCSRVRFYLTLRGQYASVIYFMSRIVLLRPPSVFSKSSFSVPVTMPLALAYLAAGLRERGHAVDVIDALGEDIEHVGTSYSEKVLYRGLSTPDILKRIPRNADALGITTMFSQDWPHIEDMINAIGREFPDMPIIMGGEHATATSRYTLESCPPVRYIAIGEGEETLADFADFLDNKKRLEDIPGLAFRKDDNTIVSNPPRARLRDLDQQPWPAWDLFDLEPYFETGEGHGVERGRSMPLVATRGCPYQCTFCSNPTMWTTRYVMRSIPRVVDEIEYYLKHYRADNIDFYDLTAIIKKDWILSFCQEIKSRGLRFSWQLPSGTRSEAMDEEVMREMASSGCMNVTYAPESGSVRTLNEIKKKVSLPRLCDSIRHAKENGIFVKSNFIIGFPRETRIDILQTLWTVVKFAWMGVDDVPLYAYSPYPGSELYEYLRGTGAIPQMDRKYFESLMTFMDLKTSTIYCENVGPREISLYRIVGMSLFYTLSYLRHPARFFRSYRNYQNHRSDTVFEERMFSLLKRQRMAKASA
jgi:anaerobic magnesium-protoporphyrin IX monomethyl ester cyclase